MASIFRRFLKQKLTDINGILHECADLMDKKGTVSFVSLSFAVFELLRKFAKGGGEKAPPPVNAVLIWVWESSVP